MEMLSKRVVQSSPGTNDTNVVDVFAVSHLHSLSRSHTLTIRLTFRGPASQTNETDNATLMISKIKETP